MYICKARGLNQQPAVHMSSTLPTELQGLALITKSLLSPVSKKNFLVSLKSCKQVSVALKIRQYSHDFIFINRGCFQSLKLHFFPISNR